MKYLIIGGGVSAFTALDTLLSRDPNASVIVLSDEGDYPYARYPLSKEVWNAKNEENNVDTTTSRTYYNNKGNLQNLYFRDNDYYLTHPNLLFLLNTSVLMLNPSKHLVLIDNNIQTVINYKKCLIATGGKPKTPDDIAIASDALDKITTYRQLKDFDLLAKEVEGKGKKIAVIGGGFLGTELAYSLSSHAQRHGFLVHSIIRESGVLPQVLPDYLSDFATNKLKEKGVYLHTNSSVSEITSHGDKVLIHLRDQPNPIEAHFAVIATGIEPNIEFANSLEVDEKNGGILCSPELQARSDLFVAGDALSYYDITSRTRRRVEHHNHALESGKHAALNMLSNNPSPFLPHPFFWTNLGDLRMVGVGTCDSSLKTYSVWINPPDYQSFPDKSYENEYFGRGIIYYLNQKNKIVGVILCGMNESLPTTLEFARRALKSPPKQNETGIIQSVPVMEIPPLFDDE